MRKPEWSTTAFTNSGGRDGSTNGAGYPDAGTAILTPSTPCSTISMGLAIAFMSNGRNANQYLGFRIGTTSHLVLTVNATSGLLELRLGSAAGTLLATASGGAFDVNVWRHVQIKATLHTTAGTALVKVDGQTVINYTGQTATVTGAVANLVFGQSTSTSISQWRLDDIYICNEVDGTATDGRPNNDLLGDLSVKTLLPTAAGDLTQMTPSTGANWAAVDEIPPSATDYVSALPGTALKDQYTITDLPAGALSVYGVRAQARAYKTDAGTATFKVGVKDAGTVSTEVEQTLSVADYPYFGNFVKKRPSDGAVFTPADINALQLALEVP